MGTKLGIVGLIGLGSLAVAAGSGYLALRSRVVDPQPAPVTAPAAAPAQAPMVSQAATSSREASAPAAVPSRTQRVSTPEAPASAPAPVAADPVSTAVNPPASTEVPATSNPVAVTPSPVSAPATPSVSPQTPVPPATRYEEVTVVADSVLGLRLESTISSKTAHVEDRIQARLSRDVLVDGRVAIPSGARLEGSVTVVESGGKFKDHPRLGIAFNTLVLADGTRVAIQTEPIYRDGDSPAGPAAAKVGSSAVVGAILGAMIGGKKGAAIGTAAGAAGGAAVVASGDRAEAALASGTPVTARLSAPITILIERGNK